MKNCEIHIRDPFILTEGDTYYMYGSLQFSRSFET